jgi:hypothetical protein
VLNVLVSVKNRPTLRRSRIASFLTIVCMSSSSNGFEKWFE